MGYYSIFDYETLRVGLVGKATTSTRNFLFSDLSVNYSREIIRIVIIVFIIVFFIIVLCLFKCLVDRYFDRLNSRQKYAKEQALALQNEN